MNDNKVNFKSPWAEKVDSYGRKRWHKEKSFSKYRSESIWAIVFNLIFLYIVNKVPDWDFKFIRDNYGAVLWILNVNILIQIGGSILIAVFNFPWIRYISRIIMESASFITVLVLFYIYPFDFSHVSGLSWIDVVLPILFIIGMVASAIKVITNTWKLIFW